MPWQYALVVGLVLGFMAGAALRRRRRPDGRAIYHYRFGLSR